MFGRRNKFLRGGFFKRGFFGRRFNLNSVKCECLGCGNIMTSKGCCPEIKCSECGGVMRRFDRPGRGR